MTIKFRTLPRLWGDQVFEVLVDGYSFLGIWKPDDGAEWYCTGIDTEDRQVADLIERHPGLGRESWDREFGSLKRDAQREIAASIRRACAIPD